MTLKIDDERVNRIVASYQSYLTAAATRCSSPARPMAIAERRLAHVNHGMVLGASGRPDEAERALPAGRRPLRAAAPD